MTLIETTPGESDADFRAAVDSILQAINPDRRNWWHPYEVRGIYECRGIHFREFYCIAGSVACWIWLSASKGGSRHVLMVSEDSDVFGPTTIVGAGREKVVAGSEIVTIRATACPNSNSGGFR